MVCHTCPCAWLPSSVVSGGTQAISSVRYASGKFSLSICEVFILTSQVTGMVYLAYGAIFAKGTPRPICANTDTMVIAMQSGASSLLSNTFAIGFQNCLFGCGFDRSSMHSQFQGRIENIKFFDQDKNSTSLASMFLIDKSDTYALVFLDWC